jgi:uncharacterized protein involved in response to NO
MTTAAGVVGVGAAMAAILLDLGLGLLAASGVFALVAIIALAGGWEVGGSSYGPVAWHAHEMLFGYTAAALTGFLLTTIPNWTGRLPVAGAPLLAIVLLWLAGRIVMAAPDLLGQGSSAVIDGAFLPVILLMALREIIAGKNWRNLKIVAGLGALSAINIGTHVAIAVAWDPTVFHRAAIAVYICLIALVGGRIVPSFTRNWLAKAGVRHLPAPFGRYDATAMIVLVVTAVCWTAQPQAPLAAGLAALSAALHLVRLWRWRGLDAVAEPMLLVLHVGYLFVPLGLAAVGLAALGALSMISALHLLTVGAIGIMTLAVMTRATMGHTGRPIQASKVTVAAFVAIVIAAAIRPVADLLPHQYIPLLAISGSAWIIAYLLFCIDYAPMLLGPKAQPVRKQQDRKNA